jgi:hypothetical protein
VRRCIIVLLAVVSGALADCSGCSVQTVHSLSECGAIVHDDTLIGDWQLWDPVLQKWDEQISITKDDSGRYQLSGGESTCFVGHLVAVGDDRFVEFQDSESVDRTPAALSTSIGTYLFAKLKVEKNKLTIWFPDYDCIKNAIAAGELNGIVANYRAVVTSSAVDLRKFLESNPTLVFRDPVTYRRSASHPANHTGNNLRKAGELQSPSVITD